MLATFISIPIIFIINITVQNTIVATSKYSITYFNLFYLMPQSSFYCFSTSFGKNDGSAYFFRMHLKISTL